MRAATGDAAPRRAPPCSGYADGHTARRALLDPGGCIFFVLGDAQTRAQLRDADDAACFLVMPCSMKKVQERARNVFTFAKSTDTTSPK